MAKRKNKYVIREGWYVLKDLAKGEFVRRTPESRKTYSRGKYEREERLYALHDLDDISRWILVPGSTRVWAGFTY